MSQPASAARASARFPSVPTGDVVASFDEYATAKRAVSALAQAGFPIEHVSIIGSDLRSVERVTGVMTYGRAALGGLASGVMLAFFAATVLLLMNPAVQLGSLLAIGAVAIGFGVIWSVIAYAVNPAKRDFTSVMQTVARRFDVLVPPQDAAAARAALASSGIRAIAPPPASGEVVSQPGDERRVGGPWYPSSPSDPSDQPGTSGASAPGAPAPRAAGGGSTAIGATAAAPPQDPARAPQDPAAPQPRPRTYGEAQDEMRRAAERDRQRDGRAG